MGKNARRILVASSIVAVLGFTSPAAFAQEAVSQQDAVSQQEAVSQDDRQEGLGVQIVGGPLFSNLTNVTNLDVGSGAGYLVGLSMGGNRGGRVGVGADVLYGKKSSEISGSNFDQSVIHVPVMLKVNLGQRTRSGFSVLALGGGFFDWQFNSKLGDIDISEDTDGYEVGLVFGAGVEFVRVSVQGRYMRGLKQIGREFDLANAADSQTQSFAILFGVRLN